MSGIVITDEMVEAAASAYWMDVYGQYRNSKKWPEDCYGGSQDLIRSGSRAAIEAALALVPQPPEGGNMEAGEPVAWAFFDKKNYDRFLNTGDRGFISDISVVPEFVERKSEEHDVTVPLYASPIPARDAARAEEVTDLVARLRQAAVDFEAMRAHAANAEDADCEPYYSEQREMEEASETAVEAAELIAALTAPVRAAEVKE